MTASSSAEQQAKEALAYAQSIIATLREPFLVLDKDLCVHTANAAFLKTFRVSKEEIEGRFLYDVGERQWDIPRLRTLLEEVLPDNNSFHDYAVEHEFPGIGLKIMLLNARRCESMNGHPELILLAFEDITERSRAEAAVQTSEVRYRRLFETAQDGILILDAADGTILDSNPFMSDLLGYSQAEFLGKQLWEIGLFTDKAENETAFRELQSYGYVRYDHLPLEAKDGTLAEVEFVSNVYTVDQRRVAQCNIRDISARGRLERQTEEQAAELTDLHRRKDEFLAMLSHELRNPLAPMVNAVQMLRLQQGNENLIQQQSRVILERQLGQLKHLVNDLLEVSRITTGRVRLRRERIVVSGVVEAAVGTVRPLMEQHQHVLTVSVPDEPIWMLADPSRLEQVLVNLLTNAAKYTNDGGRIWLSVAEAEDMCVLRVRDTGVGIPADLLPRIFDLFTQADRLLDRADGGLGIGLCLVQRLVELHGGTVEANSVVGHGSEFVVRMPVARRSAPRLPSFEPAEVIAVSNALRVLVVDDNIDMAESMAMLVKVAGHDVRTIHEGHGVLEATLEFRPHVILLDIGLPGMDGHEVGRAIREVPELEGVVLVAVTGYGQDSDRQASREAGFSHHLVKPVDFKDVETILTGVVPDLPTPV
jgi:PAS domain S-box-containing protein